MNSIKVCEYSRSRSFHDDLILQDQASGERSQDQWSSGLKLYRPVCVRPGRKPRRPVFSRRGSFIISERSGIVIEHLT